jgi:hypothetical protein
MERKHLIERKGKLEKPETLKSLPNEEGIFILGHEKHLFLEKIRNLRSDTKSVCKQQDNFYGLALKYRQTLNN